MPSVAEKCIAVAPSDVSAESESQLKSADAVCCNNTASEDVQAFAVLLPSTRCDSSNSTEIVESRVIRSQRESVKPKNCYSGVDSETSSETSSSTV